MKKRKYQLGGSIDYNAVFQAAHQRKELEKQQKQQQAQSVFNLAGTVAGFIPGAQFAAPLLPMLGNVVSQSLNTGGLVKTNGQKDTRLSSSSFQVNGYPSTTDGNNYLTNSGKVKLDDNEVVDNTYVFSDVIYDPRTGKKFSDSARNIQISKGKAEKALQLAPHDVASTNTVKHLDAMSKSLEMAQESVATRLGHRSDSYQKGGNIEKSNPFFDVANAGVTIAKYFPLTAPFARSVDLAVDGHQTYQDIKTDNTDAMNSLATVGNAFSTIPAATAARQASRKAFGKTLGIADDFNTVLKGLHAVNPLYHNTDIQKGKPHYFEKFQNGGRLNTSQYKLPSTTDPNAIISSDNYKLPPTGVVPIPAVPPGTHLLPSTLGTVPSTVLPPDAPSMVDMIKAAQASKKMQTGGDIQQLGYKDNSPYNNLPYIDINSNNITMEGVSSPVMAYPNNDAPTMMYPDQNYLFPNSTTVKEIKMQTGGDWITQFQQGYATAFPAANYRPTGKLDKKTKELLNSEYGKMFVRNNALYYDKDRGMLNTLAETKSLAAQGLARTPTNLEQLVNPDTKQQVKMNVAEVLRLPFATSSVGKPSPQSPVPNVPSANHPFHNPSLSDPFPTTYLPSITTLPSANIPTIDPVSAGQAVQERLGRVNSFSEDTPISTNSGSFLKSNAGDIAQFVEVGSKFIDVFKKPEVESLRVDPTQITKQSFDPGAALYNSNRNYLNQVNSINTGSVNVDRALKTNAAVNRSNQDSRIISDYERMNNELNIDYEKRLQEKNRYNIQRSDYTNTINSQNRAARDAAMQNAFTSVGNLGEAYNNKKVQADIIEMYKKLFSTK